MIERHAVSSSNVASIGWEDNTLAVGFKNGSVYEYEGVPEDVYQQLNASDSKGKFLASQVKGKYSYKRVV